MTTKNINPSNLQTVIGNELRYLKEKGFAVEFPSADSCEGSRAVLVHATKESVSKKGVHFRVTLSFLKENPESAPMWALSVKIDNDLTHNYRSKNFAAAIAYLDSEYRQ